MCIFCVGEDVSVSIYFNFRLHKICVEMNNMSLG